MLDNYSLWTYFTMGIYKPASSITNVVHKQDECIIEKADQLQDGCNIAQIAVDISIDLIRYDRYLIKYHLI